MKKIVFMMAGLFLLASCNNSGDKSADSKVKYSDLANDLLKGDIESIEDTPFQVDSTGKIGAMDSCCFDVTQYDANGNAVKFTQTGIVKIAMSSIPKNKKDNKGEVIETTAEITSFLLNRASLALVPFAAFGAHKESEWYHLSVGTCPIDEIPIMLETLKAALDRLQ